MRDVKLTRIKIWRRKYNNKRGKKREMIEGGREHRLVCGDRFLRRVRRFGTGIVGEEEEKQNE